VPALSAHRFFVGPGVISDGRAVIGADQARQIATVLRLGPGDTVVLLRDGLEHDVRLETVGRDRAEGVVTGRRPAANEPRLRLTLALPLLRGDRSEEVLEAVTQLGVSRVVPFTSERSVARELSRAKRERWERVTRESAETARRASVPEIHELCSWPDLFGSLEGPAIVAWEEAETSLRIGPVAADRASLIVGPEGGLTGSEIDLARERGAEIVSLGPRTLRSETAAIAAVAMLIGWSEG